VKEDTTISLEGQHSVDVPVPLPTASLVSPIPDASPEEYAQQYAIAAASPPEQALSEAEPPIPDDPAAISQSSGTGNATVIAQPPLHGGDSTEMPMPGPVSEPPVVVKQTRKGR